MGNWSASNKLKNSPGARETQVDKGGFTGPRSTNTCNGPIHEVLDDLNTPLLAKIATSNLAKRQT